MTKGWHANNDGQLAHTSYYGCMHRLTYIMYDAGWLSENRYYVTSTVEVEISEVLLKVKFIDKLGMQSRLIGIGGSILAIENFDLRLPASK